MSLVSHRGAAGIAHENSLEAIKKAETFFPVFIETDIHCTSDMVFVLYHGALKQTLSGENIPLTYAELKKRVPTLLKLEDLLEDKSITTAFMFDIKCADVIDDLIAYLQHQGLPSSVGFTSPHAEALYKLKQAFPSSITLISQPYQEGPVKAIEFARDYGFSGISLNKWWLGPLPYFMCKRYKKQMMVYTIDHRLWQWFAQTFFPNIMLCTNHPERYRHSFPHLPKRTIQA
jgi:glycerophosphoryl diester phosphodiesterase